MIQKWWLVICLVLLFAPAMGQTPAPRPMPRANVVFVHTPDSAGAAIRTLAQALLNKGYALHQINKQEPVRGLLTAPKSLTKKVIVTLRATVTATQGGAMIQLWGSYRWGEQDASWTPIDFRGQRNSLTQIAWQGLQAAGSAYPGGVITYAKQ